MIMEIKIRARKLVLTGVTDVEKAFVKLFEMDFSEISFMNYANGLVAEMIAIAEARKKAI